MSNISAFSIINYSSFDHLIFVRWIVRYFCTETVKIQNLFLQLLQLNTEVLLSSIICSTEVRLSGTL